MQFSLECKFVRQFLNNGQTMLRQPAFRKIFLREPHSRKFLAKAFLGRSHEATYMHVDHLLAYPTGRPHKATYMHDDHLLAIQQAAHTRQPICMHVQDTFRRYFYKSLCQPFRD